jgi:hypothetical protein
MRGRNQGPKIRFACLHKAVVFCWVVSRIPKEWKNLLGLRLEIRLGSMELRHGVSYSIATICLRCILPQSFLCSILETALGDKKENASENRLDEQQLYQCQHQRVHARKDDRSNISTLLYHIDQDLNLDA